MKAIKDTVYQVLKEAGRPLHYREITLEKRLIKSEGKTLVTRCRN